VLTGSGGPSLRTCKILHSYEAPSQKSGGSGAVVIVNWPITLAGEAIGALALISDGLTGSLHCISSP